MSANEWKQSPHLSKRVVYALIVLACLIGPVTYVLVAHYGYDSPGFPLDDAWIYQVYARNLAHSGQWAFVAGEPSTGSTSILWTLLIAPAYAIGLDGRAWTLALGTLTLIGAALASASLFDEDRPLLKLAAGLGVALEWHLVWAAVSGMETGLFAALLMWFWVWMRRRAPSFGERPLRDGFLLGLWGGILTLARPDGIVAFGIAAAYGFAALPGWSGRFRWAAASALGLSTLIIPLLAFNFATSGSLWPNTFAAKQAEYAPLLAQPYLTRLVEQFATIWVGPQIVLIPGLVIAARRVFAEKSGGWAGVLPLVWVIAHLALYAARLPVTYQHARYAIPVIPLVIVYGIHGLGAAIRLRSPRLMVRAGSLAWAATAAILFPSFLAALGAPAYGRDNRFIRDEMISVARWIDQNTRPDAVIAVHDIGALGYFSPRQIVDLAGLVSPDVIGFINDDEQLADYIIAQRAEYLVVFPRWSAAYARLVSEDRFCRVWSADQVDDYVQASDAGPMTVYRVGDASGCPPQP